MSDWRSVGVTFAADYHRYIATQGGFLLSRAAVGTSTEMHSLNNYQTRQ